MFLISSTVQVPSSGYGTAVAKPRQDSIASPVDPDATFQPELVSNSELREKVYIYLYSSLSSCSLPQSAVLCNAFCFSPSLAMCNNLQVHSSRYGVALPKVRRDSDVSPIDPEVLRMHAPPNPPLDPDTNTQAHTRLCGVFFYIAQLSCAAVLPIPHDRYT